MKVICEVCVCFSHTLYCFSIAQQPSLQLFEIKKSEKSSYTRSDEEEPPNFHVAGPGQPSLAPAEDKKGFATSVIGSKIKLPMAAKFCKPAGWYDKDSGPQ